MGLCSIIYITGIYEPDVVYVGHGEITDEGEEVKYSSETKKEYVYEQIIVILAVGGFFGFAGMNAQNYAATYDKSQD
jgi:hypothetical protein